MPGQQKSRTSGRRRGSVGQPCRSRSRAPSPRQPQQSRAAARVQANPRSVRTVSLTLHEARARAALLADVTYDVALDLTDRETFGVRTRVTFTCAEPGASTFLELHAAHQVRVDGGEAEYADGRIPLRDLGATNEVVVEARLPYVTDGEGLHTFTDPADGEVYASAYIGMDLAHRVFPCFDQNDLKAPISLRVTAPAHWTVLANGRPVGAAGDGRWEFATTPPIPPAMFVVCGGPWVSVTWEHAGLDFGWHARASLAGPLERDAADLRRVTETCFDHYARIFEEPYPFDSYDQVMVPGPELGSRRDAGLHHLPRRAAAAQRPHRARTTRPLDGHRARDGPHVVRRPRHHDVVGGHLAPGVLRRLPRLPRLRGGRRHRGRLRRLHDRPEARGVRRRRATVHPPRGPACRGRAGRGRGLDELRLAVLRQGQLRAPSAGHLDRRRRVLRGRERLPVPAPVAQRHPRRLRHRPGRRLRPRRPGLGRGVAASHRLRHAPGHA